jgi:hypothetical protein
MLPPDRAGGVQYLPLQDLFEQLHTSEQGLTEQEAQRRLSEIGPNETVGVRNTTAIVQLLRLVSQSTDHQLTACQLLFLAGMTITYLLLVELVKRRLMRRLLR